MTGLSRRLRMKKNSIPRDASVSHCRQFYVFLQRSVVLKSIGTLHTLVVSFTTFL